MSRHCRDINLANHMQHVSSLDGRLRRTVIKIWNILDKVILESHATFHKVFTMITAVQLGMTQSTPNLALNQIPMIHQRGESNMAIHADWGRSSSRFFNVIRIWGGTTIDVPVSGPIVSWIYFIFAIFLALCWVIATSVKLQGFINLLCSQVLGEQAIALPKTLPETCSSKITNKFPDLQIFRAWLICVQQNLHQLCFNATRQRHLPRPSGPDIATGSEMKLLDGGTYISTSNAAIIRTPTESSPLSTHQRQYLSSIWPRLSQMTPMRGR
jgi:hypothetical protein